MKGSLVMGRNLAKVCENVKLDCEPHWVSFGLGPRKVNLKSDCLVAADRVIQFDQNVL